MSTDTQPPTTLLLPLPGSLLKVRDRHTGYELPGEWARADDYDCLDDECPACGSSPGQQCNAQDEDGDGVEVGAYVHVERTGEP